jgi:hypothetical protein
MMSNKPYKEIDAISPENVEAIRRKTAHSMPDAPSAAGMKPDQIRRLFWEAIAGDKLSLMAELQRVIREANGALGDIAHFMDGTGEGQSIADVIQTGLLASYTLTQLFAGLKDGTALPLISSGVAGYSMAAYLSKLQREIDLKAKQGDKGDPGEAAGFGEITTEVETLGEGEQARVVVTAEGEDVAKAFHFAFSIPRGRQGERGLVGPQGIQGIQGPQGAPGKAFAIAKIYGSEEEMHADFDNEEIAIGEFVMINTGSVEDEENSRIYVKAEDKYSYVTDMSGATGIQGPPGAPGPAGETPYIGANGNWWIGTTDTGIAASGVSQVEFDALVNEVGGFRPEIDANTSMIEQHSEDLVLLREQVEGMDGIPSFNLAALGLPVVPMDGTMVNAEADTTDIMAALDKGAIKIIAAFAMGADTVTAEVVMTAIHVGAMGVYICSYPFDYEGMKLMFNLVVGDGAIGAYYSDLSGGEEVPTAIDLSGIDASGTIVETYADGSTKTSTMEFDADGNPIKITDGDGNVTTLTW